MESTTDHDILWDDEEMNDLSQLSRILLKTCHDDWEKFTEVLATPSTERIPEESDYYSWVEELIDDCDGDLTNGELSHLFIYILECENISEKLDWKGEMGEGQLAHFVAEKVYSLTGKCNAEQLEALLTEITSEKALAKVCDINKVHIQIIFDRLQAQLNKYGLILAHIADGNDCYNVVVVTESDFTKLQHVNAEYLIVKACSS